VSLLVGTDSASIASLLLGNRHVCGVVGDGTCVGAVLEADVTGLAPRSAPGVADLPVGRGVHSHSLHAVIHVLRAGRHDATCVTVPTASI